MSGATEFEYSDQDNVNAVRTHTGRVSAIISSIFLALAALNVVLDWRIGVPVTGDILFWLSISLFIFFLVWDWLRDGMVRRNFRQSLPMRSPIRLSWDKKAITFDTDLSHAVGGLLSLDGIVDQSAVVPGLHFLLPGPATSSTRRRL